MKFAIYIVNIFLICNLLSSEAFGQQANSTKNTVKPVLLPRGIDTIPVPSTQQGETERFSQIQQQTLSDTIDQPYKISKDALQEEAIYTAKDTQWTDIENKRIHLVGQAEVEYGPIKIKADSIVINMGENIVEAYRLVLKSNENSALPSFEGEGNTFTFTRMRYNFDTKKGEVFDARSQEGEFWMVGTRTKYISGPTDSLGVKGDDRIYNADAIITTCNHNPPHFGIRADKMKFVPKKLAVLSLAQVEIERVPTPLFLPFGFFPLIKGKSSGLIFPSSYDYNEQFGLGFRDFGYYWPISDYADLQITGDVYMRGTWGIKAATDYKKRYGYTGNVELGLRTDVLDNEQTGGKIRNRAFSIRVRHNQDSKAHPFIRVGGSVNFSTNRYDRRTNFSARSQLENTVSSNFSYQHDMPGTPFRFASEFRHSQNIQTGIMDITLPNVTLRMNTIFPLKPKNVTKEHWSHNIALQYNSELKNFVKIKDSLLFTPTLVENLQTGIAHRASLNTSFRVLKYFNLSPSVNYDEIWLTKRYERELLTDINNQIIDTITGEIVGYKAPIERFYSKFGAYRDFSSGVSLSTQVFGKINGGKRFFRGIRHIVKPSVSFGYRPATKDRYTEVVNTDPRTKFNKPLEYSIYTNSPFGTLSGYEEQLALNYSINNIIEAKYFSRKDSIEKKVRLFDNIGINGSHNFVNDTMPWSQVSINGNTTILKGLTNFNFSTRFSPYVTDEKGRITNELVWNAEKRPFKFLERVAFNGQFTSTVSFGKIVELITGNSKSNNTTSPTNAPENKSDRSDSTIDGPAADSKPKKEIVLPSLADWFNNFSFSHSYNFEIRSLQTKDTFIVSSHSISINGSIPLTKNWNLSIGNIAYDIKSKAIPYPYFGLSRDLHCWQMNFTWAPDFGTYSFFIGVKSGALNFIKYDYGQQNATGIFNGGRR